MTPSDHLDGMPTDHLSRYMRVDTTFVGGEVLVHGEADHHWAVIEELPLDPLVVGQDLE